MNLNILLALLEEKGIIDGDEAERLADHLASGIQSTYYKDAQATVKKLLDTK